MGGRMPVMMDWWWLRKLKSPNAIDRANALGRLSGSKNSKVTAAIVRALRDLSPQVRAAGAWAASPRANEAQLKRALTTALSDPDPHVVEAVAHALGRTRDSQVADQLGRAAEQNIGNPGLVLALLRAAKSAHGDEAVSERVLAILLRPEFPSSEHRSLMDLLPSTVIRDELIDEGVREPVVISILAERGEAESIPSLIGLLLRTGDFLLWSGEERAKKIRSALNSISPEWFKSEYTSRMLPEIEAALNCVTDFVRLEAVRILAQIGGKRSAELLVEKTKDNDYSVQIEAIHGLGHIGGADAVRALAAVIDSNPSGGRRDAADRLLRALLEQADHGRGRAEMLSALLRALQSSGGYGQLIKLTERAEEDLRKQVLVALADMGNPKALAACAEAFLGEKTETLRETALAGVEKFVGTLTGSDSLRSIAPRLISDLRGRWDRFSPRVARLLIESEDAHVVAMVRDGVAIPRVREFFGDPMYRLADLEPILPVIISLLSADDVQALATAQNVVFTYEVELTAADLGLTSDHPDSWGFEQPVIRTECRTRYISLEGVRSVATKELTRRGLSKSE